MSRKYSVQYFPRVVTESLTVGKLVPGLSLDSNIHQGVTTINGPLYLLNPNPPVNPHEAISKKYLDQYQSGIYVRPAVNVATTGPIIGNPPFNATFNLGFAINANDKGRYSFISFTDDITKPIYNIDGIQLSLGFRILIKDEVDEKYNGIYVLIKDPNRDPLKPILSRADDFDNYPITNNEIRSGVVYYVERGLLNAGINFISSVDVPYVINTTPIRFYKFYGFGNSINGDFTIEQTAYIKDDLSVSHDGYIGNNLEVANTLTVNNITINNFLSVSGSVTLSNSLSVFGNVNISNDLYVYGNVFFSKPIDISTPFFINSTLSVAEPVYFNNTLNVSKDTYLNSNLSVSGDTYINSVVSINGTTYLNNELSINGTTYLNNELSINGLTTINNSLSVDGTTYLNNELSINGLTTINNSLSVVGSVNINNVLSVSNSSYFDDNVYINKNLYVIGDTFNANVVSMVVEDPLIVIGNNVNDFTLNKGIICLEDNFNNYTGLVKDTKWHLISQYQVDPTYLNNVSISSVSYDNFKIGNLEVYDISASQNIYVGNQLSVYSNTYLENNLYVSGNVELSSILSVNGTVFLSNILSVSDNVFIESNLSVNNTIYTNNLHINNILSVADNTYINNNLSILNNTYINGGLSVSNASYCGNTLYVDGIVYADNVNIYSDKKLKTNIKNIDNALDIVKSLSGVIYDRVDIKETHIGFIAQEVESVLPYTVKEDGQGTKTVAYHQIIAVLVEAVKELSEKVEKLQNIIV